MWGRPFVLWQISVEKIVGVLRNVSYKFRRRFAETRTPIPIGLKYAALIKIYRCLLPQAAKG
ncbi:hypothetical protein THS27_05295 [Thalassospira sp. MCCC 1A01428]|nr:hypothetical protein THS27_05295 [Thalassospira sp. MCCC 1A01428]